MNKNKKNKLQVTKLTNLVECAQRYRRLTDRICESIVKEAAAVHGHTQARIRPPTINIF